MVRLEDHPAFVTSIRSVGSSLQLPVPCQALTQCIRDLGARCIGAASACVVSAKCVCHTLLAADKSPTISGSHSRKNPCEIKRSL